MEERWRWADWRQPTIIDSSITRLLVLTKQMLQGMEQWSQAQISEEDVSTGCETRRETDDRYLISMSNWATGSSCVWMLFERLD